MEVSPANISLLCLYYYFTFYVKMNVVQLPNKGTPFIHSFIVKVIILVIDYICNQSAEGVITFVL